MDAFGQIYTPLDDVTFLTFISKKSAVKFVTCDCNRANWCEFCLTFQFIAQKETIFLKFPTLSNELSIFTISIEIFPRVICSKLLNRFVENSKYSIGNIDEQ